ncbi:branched-chain amino acid ABC transporter permease [Actinomycetes bacterium]|nr:branched-chain amino acid ABC transporter permease [Actinomycetes bacterium]
MTRSSDGRRRPITSSAIGIGLATGAYGLSFGAISVASGLTTIQTQTLSLLMFTGASQFALVGVLGAGGGAIAAVLTAWLLGARNGLYALHLAPTLNLHGFRKPVAAQLTIDESTAMSIAHETTVAASRHAFWATGISVYVLWNLGTLLGALGASALGDPAVLGLDAAIPAGFLALLWPRLRDRTAWAIAAGGATVALVLTPLTRSGVPVLASALIAVLAGYRLRDRT